MAMLSSLGALQYVVAIINAKKKDTFLGLKLGVAQVYKKILFPSRDVDLAWIDMNDRNEQWQNWHYKDGWAHYKGTNLLQQNPCFKSKYSPKKYTKSEP
jgi:hypothetical protein